MGARIRSMPAGVERALLEWYSPRRQAYPWRRRPTPYRVLVSEVMLQQTQVARVVPAYRAFLKRFPSPRALAAASTADVLRAWSGLGYNRRALALQRTVRQLAGHRWPSDVANLQQLPGVGPYTASAVASIAFGVPVAAVDVNVRRIVSRVALGHDHGSHVELIAQASVSRRCPGDWNQALMDLGREICKPAAPQCHACPLSRWCSFFATDAIPLPPVRTQGRFEGSARQARGAVLKVLSAAPSPMRLGVVVERSGLSESRVHDAVRALAGEGSVVAGPAAMAGRAAGIVRLPG